jgi:hypothetical protein
MPTVCKRPEGHECMRAEQLRKFLELTQANELILFLDFYRLEDRLRSYEIVAGLFLKPTIK